MSDFSYDYSVLVICEPDFLHTVIDKDAYVAKLNGFLTKRAGESNLRIISVSGRYGIPFDSLIDVDDRNKTAFIKSLDDHLNQFDEMVVIANFENDPYVSALGNCAGELSKTFTIYGYGTLSNEKS
ncbi:hypothetical protein PQD71_gp206 [Kosakonia phage Kc263]|uniref:Uncharacterized protein n=1 Tax=Kosakonia phage Kc263 TaxID=2863194 RepID=A0AAE8BEI8_9CAUD|nr:hypothetical protein PQD71_gp206 [Kosakonia phage Kc263]QYN80120.1 hypothetical protein [Kosakonia phage Kc263]